MTAELSDGEGSPLSFFVGVLSPEDPDAPEDYRGFAIHTVDEDDAVRRAEIAHPGYVVVEVYEPMQGCSDCTERR